MKKSCKKILLLEKLKFQSKLSALEKEVLKEMEQLKKEIEKDIGEWKDKHVKNED